MSMPNAPNKDQTSNTFFRFQAGDPEAFRYYFDKYHSSLLKYFTRLVADKQAAEDITSDAFAKLYERRNAIVSERHLRGFLVKINKTEFQIYLRHIKCREKIEIGFDLAENNTYIDLRENEQQRFWLYKELALAIDRLPPLKKKVVLLYFYEKKKTRFIASHLRVAEQTVRNQLTKAKVLVRKSLDLSLQSHYK